MILISISQTGGRLLGHSGVLYLFRCRIIWYKLSFPKAEVRAKTQQIRQATHCKKTKTKQLSVCPSGHQIEGSLFYLASLSYYSTVALGILFQTWPPFLPVLWPHLPCVHENLNVKMSRWWLMDGTLWGVWLSFHVLNSLCGMPLPRITT